MTGEVHVSFVAPRALIEGAVEAMGRYAGSRDEGALVRSLGEAWSLHQKRRRVQLTDLDGTERRRIERIAGDDPGLVNALGTVPAQVRKAALADVRRHASMLERLRQMAAPQVVQDRARMSLARSIAALDSASPMPVEEAPGLSYAGEADGSRTVNLHDWLEQLLRSALGSGGSDRAIARSLGAELGDPIRRQRPTPSAGGRCWPGIDLTTYGSEPGHPMWRHPRLILPRPLEAGGTVVVGVSGGPATFAVAGDAPASAVGAALAREVRALSPGDSVVSFAALDEGVTAPWGSD